MSRIPLRRDKLRSILDDMQPEGFGLDQSKGKRRPKTLSIGPTPFIDVVAQTKELMEAQRWSEFTAKHWLGMYVLLHEQVYKVKPLEVRKVWRQALRHVGSFVKNQFGGDPLRMVEYMRWAWKRERGTVKWRKREGIESDFRITWRYLFSEGKLLTDYRVHLVNDG